MFMHLRAEQILPDLSRDASSAFGIPEDAIVSATHALIIDICS